MHLSGPPAPMHLSGFAPDVLTGADPGNTIMAAHLEPALLMVNSHG